MKQQLPLELLPVVLDYTGIKIGHTVKVQELFVFIFVIAPQLRDGSYSVFRQMHSWQH